MDPAAPPLQAVSSSTRSGSKVAAQPSQANLAATSPTLTPHGWANAKDALKRSKDLWPRARVMGRTADLGRRPCSSAKPADPRASTVGQRSESSTREPAHGRPVLGLEDAARRPPYRHSWQAREDIIGNATRIRMVWIYSAAPEPHAGPLHEGARTRGSRSHRWPGRHWELPEATQRHTPAVASGGAPAAAQHPAS